ncbi:MULTISPECIES: hypothetical protein [Pseudomonas]|jgi:hypothetical protein|uniref:hypothetical protein n=1 Tax=Pseudomonas TaxID=286 RepID=UPI00059D7380|nr:MULTISPECIES: hypothetical protein [Pseudomonas]AZZ76648.1 hypothetical protein CCX46_16320 [Pseudomonas sp. RU47]MBB4055104.1 hypothetical protein [Pseudomonas koreensis]QUE91228.1 hypothetical protein KBP52_01915 [Pseudomonas sp. SCA2728.1_7]TSB49311.1 hypothetical protein FEE99_25775 [Pseudomonas sp. ef1]
MRKFKLKYLNDSDDSCPKYYESAEPIKVGDAILVDNGFWHGVTDIRILKTDIRLTLSKSSQSPEEAKLVMKQLLSDW